MQDSPGSLNDVLVVGQEISSSKQVGNGDHGREAIDDSSPYYKDRHQTQAYFEPTYFT
jgi:hypothetical protein